MPVAKIQGGRLLISEEFARALGRPSDAGAKLEKSQLAWRCNRSRSRQWSTAKPNRWPSHRCISRARNDSRSRRDCWDLPAMHSSAALEHRWVWRSQQLLATRNRRLNWFALPQTDHPVIPQNLYRMSGGANNDERFEQIGQSWFKHAFAALTQNACNFGCNGVGGSHLAPGVPTRLSSLNGDQNSIGSRAWVNPFTGAYPSTANNHSGHATTACRTGFGSRSMI